MKVVTDPARVDDLLRFLRQVGYVAEEVDYALVRVGRGSVQGPLEIKLEHALRVWRTVNDGVEARIVAEHTETRAR